ncbi:MAG: hypothetical protein LBK07_07325 [Tannerella sp.]|jgi:hypothetical protein|nr:hypothetical protein [Tannerella sp.]
MKKCFVFMMIALFMSAAVYAQHRDRKGVIHVQGHPHEYLTKLHGGKEDVKTRAVTGSTADINLADIICWAGSPDTTRTIDSAVLVIKWTSLPPAYVQDSILIWGYRWNPQTAEGWDVTKYTVDMIRAVANADCRFVALLQNSNGGSIAAGGFGYNYGDDVERPSVWFDYNHASMDDTIKFHYEGPPNCEYGQGAIPYNLDSQWQEADRRAGVPNYSSGTGNGIIRHPFDADYGYPAYDFDYWIRSTPIIVPTRPYSWQAGWYYSYWAFYHKEQLTGGFVADSLTITTRQLGNHYVDGFVFEDQPLIWPPTHDMSGNYNLPYDCNCGCTGVNAIVEQKGKRK